MDGVSDLQMRAARDVLITRVLRSLGADISDGAEYSGDSIKIHCPFGHRHSDGGLEKALRVYPSTNSSYCFSEKRYYDSVLLWASDNELSYVEAVRSLLETFNISTFTVLDQRPERKPSIAELKAVLDYVVLPGECRVVAETALGLVRNRLDAEAWYRYVIDRRLK